MSFSPNISVIIPTLNEEERIGTLLKTLTHQTYAPTEIIVVDGNSTDQTQSIVRKYKQARVLTVKNPSPGRQRTAGGKEAKGEILFFLDADVEIQSDTIDRLMNEFERKRLAIAVPLYSPSSENISIRLVYGIFNILFFLLQFFQPSGAGSAIIVRKDVFRKVGGFKPDHHYDDIVFIRKAASYGTFRQIRIPVTVSSRRFEQYGILRMTFHYAILSVLFFFGLYSTAEKLQYEFGNYKSFTAQNQQ